MVDSRLIIKSVGAGSSYGIWRPKARDAIIDKALGVVSSRIVKC